MISHLFRSMTCLDCEELAQKYGGDSYSEARRRFVLGPPIDC